MPRLARVTVMFNPDTAPHSIFWPAPEIAAPSVGVKLVRATVHDEVEIESAIAVWQTTRPLVSITGHVVGKGVAIRYQNDWL